MRNSARWVLAIVVFMSALLLAPWRGQTGTPDAAAQVARQPTPNLCDVLCDPSPDDDDDDDGGSGGGDDDGGSGGGDDDGSGGGDDDLIPGGEDNDGQGDGGKGDDATGKGKRGKKDPDGEGPRGPKGKGKGKGKGKKKDKELPLGTYEGIPGSFNTNKLVAVAAQLRGLGVPQSDVIRKVYPPFIIAGRASWIDTWHAPRYGPAPGQIRQHEGQDVFCAYGDPILAPVDGTVSFSNGGLGGITARVHMSDGSYWYLTHLSDLNTEQFSAGDAVKVGDIVGYCGNSGNAATTPPHVHFGWYLKNGKAKNPMESLVDWLQTAEKRVLGVVSKKTAQKAKKQPLHTAARRMGDDFVPKVSEFRVAGESLWASGSDPGIGATALAEAALRAALSTRGLDYGEPTPIGVSPEDSENVSSFLQPDSALGRLLQSRHVSASEVGD